jgi:hypothetical protein
MITEQIRSTLRLSLSEERREGLRACFRRRALLRRLIGFDLDALAKIHGTDKAGPHDYIRHYKDHFGPLRWRRLNLLEIGIGGYSHPDQGGQSLRMWKDYFPRANIFGIDIHDKSPLEEARIRIFQGSQADPDFLKRVVDEIGRIDIIIDDGSHINEHVIASFNKLFPLLADHGIYAIEDLETAYWPDYGGSADPDCQTTSIAMCKRLIDGLQWKDIADRQPSYFDQHVVAMHCYRELILIYKGVNNRPDDGANGTISTNG